MLSEGTSLNTWLLDRHDRLLDDLIELDLGCGHLVSLRSDLIRRVSVDLAYLPFLKGLLLI